MKYITFAVPCYNSENYMEHAVNSLLKGGDDVEIIIVDDGSTDKTAKIADSFQKSYPNIIKVIHKKNGGHGSGVNAGLKVAKGLYYKVVDSDDWVNEDSLKKLLTTIKEMHSKKTDIDMYIVNYVYEKSGERPKEISYKCAIKPNKVIGWDEVNKFKTGQYLLMHSVVYNTKFLRKTKILLPEHTFYVDNIFVYYPLPSVKTMYYLDIPFYRYFIGRDDQSVNAKNMIKRIDQQIFVTKSMIDYFDPFAYEEENPKLCDYLIKYMDIMMTVSTIFLKIANTPSHDKRMEDLWDYLHTHNEKLYNYCKKHVSGLSKLPRFISVPGYHIARKVFKFN